MAESAMKEMKQKIDFVAGIFGAGKSSGDGEGLPPEASSMKLDEIAKLDLQAQLALLSKAPKQGSRGK